MLHRYRSVSSTQPLRKRNCHLHAELMTFNGLTVAKPQLFPHYYKPNHLPRIEALGRVYAYLPREKGWVSNKQGKKDPRIPLQRHLFSSHSFWPVISYAYLQCQQPCLLFANFMSGGGGGFTYATTGIGNPTSPHFSLDLAPQSRQIRQSFYRLRGLRLDAFHISISFLSFLAVETSSTQLNNKITTDLLLLDWINFANSVLFF